MGNGYFSCEVGINKKSPYLCNILQDNHQGRNLFLFETNNDTGASKFTLANNNISTIKNMGKKSRRSGSSGRYRGMYVHLFIYSYTRNYQSRN